MHHCIFIWLSMCRMVYVYFLVFADTHRAYNRGVVRLNCFSCSVTYKDGLLVRKLLSISIFQVRLRTTTLINIALHHYAPYAYCRTVSKLIAKPTEYNAARKQRVGDILCSVFNLYRLDRKRPFQRVRHRDGRRRADIEAPRRRRDVDATTATITKVGDTRLQPDTRVRSPLSGRSLCPTHRHVAQAGRRGSHLYFVRRLPTSHGLVVLRPHSRSGAGVNRAVRHQDV